MASTTANIVLLQANGVERIEFEKVAAATVTPGDLLEFTSSGTVTPVASAAKQQTGIFALVNPFAPDPKATALSQAYASGDQVRMIYAQRGDLVNARLATSQTIAVGDYLTSSATAGCLQKISTIDATTVTGALVGVAEVAVTTTGSVGRVTVRIL